MATRNFFLQQGDHAEAVRTEYPEILPGHVRPLFGLTETPNRCFDTVVMGRETYDIARRMGITDPDPHLRSVVFSRSMTEAPDPAVEVFGQDPLGKLREIKRESGAGIWLCGGGELAAALRTEIDRLIVELQPVVTGTGIPMFAGEFGVEQLDLTEVRRFDSGVVHLTYTKG